jgi:hypothetical protein
LNSGLHTCKAVHFALIILEVGSQELFAWAGLVFHPPDLSFPKTRITGVTFWWLFDIIFNISGWKVRSKHFFFFLSETGSDYVAQVDLQLLIPQPQPPECWMTGECHHSRLHLLFLCGEVELTAVPIYVFFLTI